jgi:hypothetical protein
VLNENPEEFYFLIREPFNNTYNPAKNFRLTDEKHVDYVTKMFR